METKTDGRCVVCGGEIVEVVVSEYNPMSGPLIIGPGSVNQFREVSKGYHCKNCGLKYEFVPQIKKQEEKRKITKRVKKICPQCGDEMIEKWSLVGSLSGRPRIHSGSFLGHWCKSCGYREKASK